jgi:hypothetical protein
MFALEDKRKGARPLDGQDALVTSGRREKSLQYDLQVATQKRANATLLNN